MSPVTSSPPAAPSEPRARRRRPGRIRPLVRCAHPRQAVLFAVVLGVLAYVDGRPAREAGVAAAAVLLVQLLNGLLNDLFDVPLDRASGVEGKPMAEGPHSAVPAGNATFAIIVLLLLAIPCSLQNGTAAGLALLATVLVAYLHNRSLHRTPFSFLGWAVTFALFPAFLSYGGWGGGVHGAPPTWWMTGAAAFLGVCYHLVTTLPDLAADHRAGVHNLPLVIALRTGATKLLVISVVLSLIGIAGVVVVALEYGLRQ